MSHLTRRDLLKISAALAAAAAGTLRKPGGLWAAAEKTDDPPVRIGYLPITDATPLLVAHARKLYEAEGLSVEKPRLFRSWAQIVEAFVSRQVNVIHLLSPTTVWVRYGTKFPGKIVAWNHLNGSALVSNHDIQTPAHFGGKTVAVPFWYSIHNIILQHVLRENGLTSVVQARAAGLGKQDVKLVVMAPQDMVPALANRSIAGYIVAEPFNALAENLKTGKVLRFTGDVWKEHACCVVFMHEADLQQRKEWSQRVVNAIVKAQLWIRGNRDATARLLAKDGEEHYTPHALPVLERVLTPGDDTGYIEQGAIRHVGWKSPRIDFQPYPYPSYTEQLIRLLKETAVEGDAGFLRTLEPAFVARDLVDDTFVKTAILQAGALKAFGLSEQFSRQEAVEQ
ncbi:hypothetical protein W02_01340 [Nitrospira sp. KM1]|uniref:ABC transporter substrate-binding protein n=1 Tax=Nitrospira sp. KM1 TaxID=1936990 RepID=UPI0013A77067|nr:ABC transporter substrate-binding protein [Nitrospira sp. KM1]BCA52994.1 hypothetical protein W02_01340 [Nitrospira sp. KM1]